mgnify:CR=1 FL=1
MKNQRNFRWKPIDSNSIESKDKQAKSTSVSDSQHESISKERSLSSINQEVRSKTRKDKSIKMEHQKSPEFRNVKEQVFNNTQGLESGDIDLKLWSTTIFNKTIQQR